MTLLVIMTINGNMTCNDYINIIMIVNDGSQHPEHPLDQLYYNSKLVTQKKNLWYLLLYLLHLERESLKGL